MIPEIICTAGHIRSIDINKFSIKGVQYVKRDSPRGFPVSPGG